MTIFPDPFDSDMQIVQVNVADEITVTLRATSPTASCPDCGTISKRIQSRYSRTLHDLPSSGRPVHLVLQVRRFRCQKSICGRKIFAEQFPELSAPHAQRTRRLQEALRQLGFSVGGQTGALVGSRLGYSGSRDTILRLVKQAEQPPASPPRVVGIDDWAWKRRLRYGTLLYDLERKTPLDLLADRSVETVAAWFQQHPSIEVISRDRASEYATAALKGAPQAVQVADRWHLVKNLGESLSALLARSRAEMGRASRTETRAEEVALAPTEQRRPYRSRQEEQAHLARHVARLERYEQIISLQRAGLKGVDIARQVGMAERTVRRWLARGTAPVSRRRRRRPSLIDPYEGYVHKRLQEGGTTGLQLYHELTAQGYRGSARAMYSYLATLRSPKVTPGQRQAATPRAQKTALALPGPLQRLSAQRITWLFLRKWADLSQAERENLQLIRQASPSIEMAYQLVQTFMLMVRERTGEQLDTWLNEVEASHLPEFEAFAKGVQQDKAAVLAGLTLPWSNDYVA
jgi:transposase